jgi:hypothetical protein
VKNLLLAAFLVGVALLLPPSWGIFSGALRFDGLGKVASVTGGGLAVPLISQYQGLSTDNFNCGPASVAAIARAVGAGAANLSDAQLVAAARAGTALADGDTDLAGLAQALRGFGIGSTNLFADDNPGSTPDPIGAIGYVVGHGRAVLALVSGVDLGRGDRYGDHWLVITAVDSRNGMVQVMDPDTQVAGSSAWQPGGIRWLPTWEMRSALRDATADGSMVALAIGAGRTQPPKPAAVLLPIAAALALWEGRGLLLSRLPGRWRRRLRRWARHNKRDGR